MFIDLKEPLANDSINKLYDYSFNRPNNITFVVSLKQKPCRNKLIAAVKLAMRECKNLKKKLICNDDFYFMPNGQAPPVFYNKKNRSLGGKSSNCYLFRVDVFGLKMEFVFSHIITDEFAAARFVKSVLESYFSEGKTNFSDREQILKSFLCDKQTSYEENPYEVCLSTDKFKFRVDKQRASFRLYKCASNVNNNKVKFSLDGARVNQICKQYDMERGVLISYIISKSIFNSYKNINIPITGAFCADLRGVFGFETSRNFSYNLPLPFGMALNKSEPRKAMSALKGFLNLQNNKENMSFWMGRDMWRYKFNQTSNEDMLKRLKCFRQNLVPENYQKFTYGFCDIGNIELSSAVKDNISAIEMIKPSIYVSMNAAVTEFNNNVNITITQNFNGDFIFSNLERELNNLKIPGNFTRDGEIYDIPIILFNDVKR